MVFMERELDGELPKEGFEDCLAQRLQIHTFHNMQLMPEETLHPLSSSAGSWMADSFEDCLAERVR